MEYYSVERMSPSTRKIVDITGVAAFLVEGEHSAVLIDTCTGTGDLYELVQSLTTKPLEVILTHGHCDHAGGAALFQRVYLNENDWDLVKQHTAIEMRKSYIRFTIGDERFDQIPENAFARGKADGYLPLSDGQIFELGGVTLEALLISGHTQGMCCILNREERSILFGDACNNSTFLWADESTSIEEYRRNLQLLKKQEDRYDTVWLSHGSTIVNKSILDEVMLVCDRIMAGTNNRQSCKFMDNTLWLAEKADETMKRLDGRMGNILYVSDKIFSK